MPRIFCDRGPKRSFLQKINLLLDHELEEEEGGWERGRGGPSSYGCHTCQYIPLGGEGGPARPHMVTCGLSRVVAVVLSTTVSMTSTSARENVKRGLSRAAAHLPQTCL